MIRFNKSKIKFRISIWARHIGMRNCAIVEEVCLLRLQNHKNVICFQEARVLNTNYRPWETIFNMKRKNSINGKMNALNISINVWSRTTWSYGSSLPWKCFPIWINQTGNNIMSHDLVSILLLDLKCCIYAFNKRYKLIMNFNKCDYNIDTNKPQFVLWIG